MIRLIPKAHQLENKSVDYDFLFWQQWAKDKW